jgi:hypothetical protein
MVGGDGEMWLSSGEYRVKEKGVRLIENVRLSPWDDDEFPVLP